MPPSSTTRMNERVWGQRPISMVPNSLTHLHRCGCEDGTIDLVFLRIAASSGFPPSLHLEHEEILVRQKRVLRPHPESVLLHLLDQIVTLDPHLQRRPHRCLYLLEIHHDDLPARLKHLLHERKIAQITFNV